MTPWWRGRPTMLGKTALGASSPAKPALHIPEPLSTTKAATSSSHILMDLLQFAAIQNSILTSLKFSKVIFLTCSLKLARFSLSFRWELVKMLWRLQHFIGGVRSHFALVSSFMTINSQRHFESPATPMGSGSSARKHLQHMYDVTRASPWWSSK